MRAPCCPISRHPHQRGFTLVELLVTVTLGLLVIAGIGQIYAAAKRSYDIQTSLARLQDAGRYAVDVITQDVRRAGYWGLTNMRANANGVPSGEVSPNNTCNGNTWGRMVKQSIFGINDSAAGYTCITWLRGDVLTVRYAEPRLGPINTNAFYIRTAPSQASIVWGSPAAPSPDPTGGGLPLNNTVTDPIFSDHALVAHAYYVKNSNDAICNGAPIPALTREQLGANGLPQAAELVLGVEHLQFQFGIDTDADRSVNQYVNANAVANWNNVVSVRFWILARDECPEAGYTNNNTYTLGDIPPYTPNDNYRRQLYTSTVALRN